MVARDGRLPDLRRRGAANVYKVGLNTTRLLMAIGDVVTGWLLLRQAEVAGEALAKGDAPPRPRQGLLPGQGRGGEVVRPQRPAGPVGAARRWPRASTST